MGIEVILDAVEAEAAGLPELARRFLQTEARHLGVPLDVSSVMARPRRRAHPWVSDDHANQGARL